MNNPAITVRNAFVRTRDILRGVQALLVALDEECARRAWLPIHEEATHHFSEEFEVVFYRGYGHNSHRKAMLTEVRGVEVHLLPNFADEAVIILFKAELETPLGPGKVWDAWSDLGDALGHRILAQEATTFRDEDATAIKGASQIVIRRLSLARGAFLDCKSRGGVIMLLPDLRLLTA